MPSLRVLKPLRKLPLREPSMRMPLLPPLTVARPAALHGRPTRGGRGNPRCGDANRRTAVVRLGTECASAARAAGPVLGLSHFSPPRCGIIVLSAVGQRRGGRGNPRCGDATQSSLVDYDKLRQGMGAFGGGCRFWNVECRVYVLPGVAHVRI